MPLQFSAIEKQWNCSEPYRNLNICLTFTALNLKNVMVRVDYRDMIEFSILFLGGDAEKIKIRPPGTMHQRMARAICSLNHRYLVLS